MPENAERRQQWDLEHQITPPEIHQAARAELKWAVDRAQQLAQISAVVTIRTRPRKQAKVGQ